MAQPLVLDLGLAKTEKYASRDSGDTVEIVECPPKSRLKRWDLVRVVEKSSAVDIAAMRAAAKVAEAENAS